VKLRLRFVIYALLGASYLAGLLATAAFVGLPALLRVDRSLAPLQSVFSAISQRQAQVVDDISLLEQLLRSPEHPPLNAFRIPRAGHGAPASLLSLYGDLLSPDASRKLAVAEDQLGAIESMLGEALARYELGDRVGVEARLRELRRAEDESQQQYSEAMLMALSTGVEARHAFQRSAVTLGWASAVWIVLGILLVLAIGYDVNRHVWLPIRALNQGVRAIAAGDWSQPVKVETADELGDLAAQFNALTETLHRRAGQHAQLATAGELLAGVAHELNNPLQAIRGTAELRAGGEPGNRDWATVLAQAQRASKLARDLVQFVRPANRDVRLTSINEVVQNAVDLIEFQYRADGVGLELDLADALPGVRCDPHEMVQVIVNLLGNSHQVLSRANGPKRVFVRTWTEARQVYCRIRDTGPGIPVEDRERVFSPFFSSKENGVGLGLSVSRNIVFGAGGNLALDNAGPGASFTIVLPGQDAVAPVERPAKASRGTLAGVRILIADDEDAIRGVLERFFLRDGAVVHAAAGGAAALDAIRRHPVDVVILDLRMPDVDGAEVYRTIRKEQPHLTDCVIFLSGDVSRVAEELHVPFDRVLVKPVELGELKRAALKIVLGETGLRFQVPDASIETLAPEA
jgi:signal transduction histidine kinase/ActR/RegA family two-component response regulator